MATLSLTMQAAIFHLSQLKTELERAKNTIEQFTNFPLSVNNGPRLIFANRLKPSRPPWIGWPTLKATT